MRRPARRQRQRRGRDARGALRRGHHDHRHRITTKATRCATDAAATDAALSLGTITETLDVDVALEIRAAATRTTRPSARTCPRPCVLPSLVLSTPMICT